MLTAEALRKSHIDKRNKENLKAQKRADKMLNKYICYINKQILKEQYFNHVLLEYTEFGSSSVLEYLIPKLKEYYTKLGYNFFPVYEYDLLEGIQIDWSEQK